MHAMLTLRGMGGGVSTLGALEAAILLLYSLQALLAHTVQAAQEVGALQFMSAQHTEEGGRSGSTVFFLVRQGAPFWSRGLRWTTAGCYCRRTSR